MVPPLAPVLTGSTTAVPLPAPGLRFMGETDERLLAIGAGLAEQLFKHGMRVDDALLDVGSGYGRLALGLMTATRFRGSYLGFDILATQTRWCSEKLTPIAPSYRFRHLDVRNDRYNPAGAVDARDARFPTGDASIDCCALFSVFTHFYREDIEHYLNEIRRVLRPGRLAVTTWLLFDEARLGAVTSAAAAYPMVHSLDAVTRFADTSDPLRAIAYEETFVRSLVAAADLQVVTVERGRWAGELGADFQDLIVIRRPRTPMEGVHAAVRQTRRRLGRVRRIATSRVRRPGRR